MFSLTSLIHLGLFDRNKCSFTEPYFLIKFSKPPGAEGARAAGTPLTDVASNLKTVARARCSPDCIAEAKEIIRMALDGYPLSELEVEIITYATALAINNALTQTGARKIICNPRRPEKRTSFGAPHSNDSSS